MSKDYDFINDVNVIKMKFNIFTREKDGINYKRMNSIDIR